jgi:hypothetical protein
LLAEVTVDETLTPLLERYWPPREQRVGRGSMIFCGAGARELAEETVVLEPASVPATVRSGLGGEASVERECARLDPRDPVTDGALLLPPPLLGGLSLEPLPLVAGSVPSPPAPVCDPDELPVGPGCALVQDDRARLRAPAVPSFWVLQQPEPSIFALEPGRSRVVRGLEPMRPARLAATVFDLGGTSENIELEVLAASPMSHVVINEVLANPVGPERTSEWVELVNDGRDAVALAGFELRDATGVARLPDAVLAPGELVLVVAEGFAPDPELDIVPPDGVQRLVVPALGGGGLANGGESLRLVDRAGRVVSRFPSVAAKEPGRSVARVTPQAPDGELAAFGAHADPGASPGSPNALVAEP